MVVFPQTDWLIVSHKINSSQKESGAHGYSVRMYWILGYRHSIYMMDYGNRWPEAHVTLSIFTIIAPATLLLPTMPCLYSEEKKYRSFPNFTKR